VVRGCAEQALRARPRRRRGAADDRSRPRLLRVFPGRRRPENTVHDGDGVGRPRKHVSRAMHRPGADCRGSGTGRRVAVAARIAPCSAAGKLFVRQGEKRRVPANWTARRNPTGSASNRANRSRFTGPARRTPRALRRAAPVPLSQHRTDTRPTGSDRHRSIVGRSWHWPLPQRSSTPRRSRRILVRNPSQRSLAWLM